MLPLVTIAVWAGCRGGSESTRDDSAGLNGSFEHAADGLPANWLLYTPRTAGSGDFDIAVDPTESKDGAQSLRFQVRECSARGGRFSPGISTEYAATPGDTYKVSFWIKNSGSEFAVKIRGVSAFDGQDGPMVNSRETTDTWQRFERTYTIPPTMRALRFEMNVLRPGRVWIDDIRIERVPAA
jgi:hypothetical protein